MINTNTTQSGDSTMTNQTIKELNDHFRKHDNFSGRVVLTANVANLEADEICDIYKLVKDFDTFTEDNDPHGEHDFGSFDYKGSKFFWKIDYYDKNNMDQGSEDASDPEKTLRVLTIMFASDY